MSAHKPCVGTPGSPAMHSGQPGGPIDNDALGKEQWVRHYAGRILQRWLKRRTPLGVAPDYIAQLERDLCAFYDQPLLRTFIEQTY